MAYYPKDLPLAVKPLWLALIARGGPYVDTVPVTRNPRRELLDVAEERIDKRSAALRRTTWTETR